MSEVAKFIPIEKNGENVENAGGIGGAMGIGAEGGNETGNSAFKVCGTTNNLPAKPSAWSKLKGFFTYEIKVELTPYQQSVEDEINEFLHQKITWQDFKNFLFQEVTFEKTKKTKV